MSKAENLKLELKEAMKQKNKNALNIIRSIRGELLKIEKSGIQEDISDDTFINIVKKLVKEKKESIELAQQARREDLVEEESIKLTHLQKYLPVSLSQEETHKLILQAIKIHQASNIKDMGKVMKEFKDLLMKQEKDADISLVAKMIKQELG